MFSTIAQLLFESSNDVLLHLFGAERKQGKCAADICSLIVTADWTQTRHGSNADQTHTETGLLWTPIGGRSRWLMARFGVQNRPRSVCVWSASSPRSIRFFWIPARSSATYMYLFFLIRKLNSPKVELKFMKYTLHYITLPHSIYLWPWFWRSNVYVTWFISVLLRPPPPDFRNVKIDTKINSAS